MRRPRGARGRGAQRGFRRRRPGGCPRAAPRVRGRAGGGDARHRAQLSGAAEQRPERAPGRHVRSDDAAAREGGDAVAVRWAGHRATGAHGSARRRGIHLCVRGEQGRCQRQRPVAVVGAGPRDRFDRPLPGVVREPAQVQPDRPPGVALQADRCRERRPVDRGGPGSPAAHGGPAGVRCHRGRAVPAGRRHRRRLARRADQRGRRAGERAATGGPADRGHRQRRRPWRPDRRCRSRGRPGRAGAARRRAAAVARGAPAGGVHRKPGGRHRVGQRPPVRRRPRHPARPAARSTPCSPSSPRVGSPPSTG